MSYHPTQETVLGRKRMQFYNEDIYQRPHQQSFDSYSSCSSSPPRSSSPPKTPYSSRGYAHVHSSPDYQGIGGRMNDAWSHLHPSWKSSPTFCPRPPSSVSTAPTSDIDPFELSQEAQSEPSVVHGVESEDEEMDDIFGLNSRNTFFRTSAERGLWKNESRPYKKASPIRLQTRKSAPSLSRIPTPTLLSTRPVSEPATSTLAQPTSFLGGSESTTSGSDVAPQASPSIFVPIDQLSQDDVTSPQILPSLTSDGDSCEDVDVTLEVEDPGILLSPLPPSSPPLSPLSRSMSVLSRSSSTLSFLPDERSSSPLSDLPDDYDDEDDFFDTQDDLSSESMTIVESEGVLEKSSEVSDSVPPHNADSRPPSNPTQPELPSKPQSSTHPADSPLSVAPQLSGLGEPVLELSAPPKSTSNSGPTAKKLFHLNDVDVVPCGLTVNSTPTHDSGPTNNTCPSPLVVNSAPAPSVFGPSVTEPSVHVDSSAVCEDKDTNDFGAELVVDNVVDAVKAEAETILPVVSVAEDDEGMKVDENADARMEDDVQVKSIVPHHTLKDCNGASTRPPSPADTTSRSTSPIELASKVKRKAKASTGPSKKRRRFDAQSDDASTSQARISDSRTPETDDEDNLENIRGSAAPAPKQKKRRRIDGESGSTSIKRTSRKRARAPTPDDDEDQDQYDEALDDESKSLHATMCGLVIETMATTRASSLPVSSICKLVMRSQPSLKSQRTEPEWLRVFERVLRDGEATRGCGVFGKVDSSGKDNSDRPLEAQWFYVPERDEDQERATLIRSMMPRPGKRTETMKYKQYYWRPLGKISKWDAEDEL